MIPQLQQRAIAYERERGTLDAALRRHDALATALARSPEWRVGRAELLLALGRDSEAERELTSASNALAALRLTPARAELAARVAELTQTAEANPAGRAGQEEIP
jgi:hypothetical protein